MARPRQRWPAQQEETDPGAYSTNALAAGNAAATREQFVAQDKIEQKSYRDYLSAKEAGKELIMYAISKC